MDELIYARYINEEIGYQVFAHNDIKADTILGEYTGEISKDLADKTYAQEFSPQIQGYTGISIHSLKMGNLLRFVNDLGEYNVDKINIPMYGTWRIFYIATQTI